MASSLAPHLGRSYRSPASSAYGGIPARVMWAGPETYGTEPVRDVYRCRDRHSPDTGGCPRSPRHGGHPADGDSSVLANLHYLKAERKKRSGRWSTNIGGTSSTEISMPFE